MLKTFCKNVKMEKKGIQKIYPTSKELSSVRSKVECPQQNCKSVFQSTSNLNMHLIKHHKIANNGLNMKTVEAQYFCPILMCPYHKDSKKHFSKLKYLKQHFLKVHAAKELMCKKCGKKFSTECFRTSHVKNCGKLFSCTCGSQYTSPEAILTHCRRKGKGHAFMRKNINDTKSYNSLQPYSKNLKKTQRFIYPKLTNDIPFPIHYIAAVALSELSSPSNLSKSAEKGIQTEITDFNGIKDICVTPNTSKDEKKKNSQETQTNSGKYKKLKISTQTQTNSYDLRQKPKANFKALFRKRKKSMETQTKTLIKGEDMEKSKKSKSFVDKFKVLENEKEKVPIFNKSKTKKCFWNNQLFNQKEPVQYSENRDAEVTHDLFNEESNLNLCSKELGLNEFNVSIKSQSHQYESEQNSENQIFDLNKLCNIETQTEIDAFLTECNEDTTFTYCSTTETQTTDDFDCLLYSNMCTQTCEEVDQLFNFNFVHIETQTTWPDLNDCQNLDS